MRTLAAVAKRQTRNDRLVANISFERSKAPVQRVTLSDPLDILSLNTFGATNSRDARRVVRPPPGGPWPGFERRDDDGAFVVRCVAKLYYRKRCATPTSSTPRLGL